MKEIDEIESAPPLTGLEFARGILAVLEEATNSLDKKVKRLTSSARFTKFLVILSAAGLAINYVIDGSGQTVLWTLLGLALISAGYVEDRLREAIREYRRIEWDLRRRHIQVRRNSDQSSLYIVAMKWAEEEPDLRK